MSEALARVRNEVLSRRVDLKRAGGALMQKVPVRFFSLSPRSYAAAALLALVAGIAINALVLQRGRHPSPLFPTAKVAPEPTAVNLQRPPPVPEAAPAPTADPSPPAQEAPSAAASAPIPPPAPHRLSAGGKRDAIGDLLHQEHAGEDAHLLQSARAALVKLGYPVKPDASESTVRDAIREYERAHGLPPTSDITPRVVKRLSEAARGAAR